jgi:hypothetical protein
MPLRVLRTTMLDQKKLEELTLKFLVQRILPLKQV